MSAEGSTETEAEAPEGTATPEAGPPASDTGLICPQCGSAAASGANFCEECGHEFAGASSGTPAGSGVPGGGTAPAVLRPTDPAPTDPPPTGSAEPSAAAPTGPCAQCGGEIADDGYCSECGAPAVRERDHWAEQPASWVGGVCDRGVRHAINEDAMALSAAADPGSFAVLVVCDGVSAAPGSDMASLAASRAARDRLAATSPPGESTAARVHAWTQRLGVAAKDANDAAAQVGREQAAAHGVAMLANPPSCTFVTAVVDGPVVVAGWVGDSRAYWLPDGGPAEQLSVDDSWATEQISLGMPREEAEALPQAHAITRWLGVDSPGHVPRCTSVTPTGPGWVAVVSDGLWNYCSPAADIAALVTSTAAECGDDPRETAGRLVQWANGRGGHDNITVALARLPGPAADAHDDPVPAAAPPPDREGD